jgi:hypothetical protein
MTASPALAIFSDDIGRIVFLPHDTQRRSVDADADVVSGAVDGDIADGNAGEAEILTAILRRKCFGRFIEHDRESPTFGARLCSGVGQDAIELLR